MRLYRTTQGWARAEADELVVLDLPDDSVATVLANHGAAAASAPERARVSLDSVELLAPINPGGTLVLMGANYLSHVLEFGLTEPKEVMGLPLTEVTPTGSNANIVLPEDAATQVDYEGEVALVVGAAASSIPAGSGWDYIAGICCANDVSARDVQSSAMKDGAVTDIGLLKQAKSYPTFKPLGPCLLTADEVRGRDDLVLRTFVNGELRQTANLSEMIFGLPAIIEGMSQRLALQPGDVILTGTPAGIGSVTGRYLVAGDVVEVRIDGVGSLKNHVVGS